MAKDSSEPWWIDWDAPSRLCQLLRPDSFPPPVLLVWASRNHLFLRCGAPISAADTHVHRQSYPRSVNSLMTVRSPRVRMAGTFSRKTNFGVSSRVSRIISKKSPLRSPARPAPAPATLRSWHGYGKPPTIMSMQLPFPSLLSMATLFLCHSWWHR